MDNAAAPAEEAETIRTPKFVGVTAVATGGPFPETEPVEVPDISAVPSLFPLVASMLASKLVTVKFTGLDAEKVSVPNWTVPRYTSAGTMFRAARKPSSGAKSMLNAVNVLLATQEWTIWPLKFVPVYNLLEEVSDLPLRSAG